MSVFSLTDARRITAPPRPRAPRPTMFFVEYGAITMRTCHGDARFDLEQARRLSGILAEGGCSSAYFDLEDAILALSEPKPAGAA